MINYINIIINKIFINDFIVHHIGGYKCQLLENVLYADAVVIIIS